MGRPPKSIGMKKQFILFSAPMVRALLSLNHTGKQTFRIWKRN
jgi:hypothetical protein